METIESDLDICLMKVFDDNKLSLERRNEIENFILYFFEILKSSNIGEITTQVIPFGSLLSNCATNDTDLDLCVLHENDNLDHEAKCVYLKGIYQLLEEHGMTKTYRSRIITKDVVPIIILKAVPYEDRFFDIDCTINNFDGLRVSKFVRRCIEADPNVRILIVLIKQWCKENNAYYKGSFNGCCVSFLTVHYMQIKGLLPSFELLNDKYGSTLNEAAFSEQKPSISELFIGFFKYCKNVDFTTKIIDVKNKKLKDRAKNIAEPIFIENPFDSTDNLASAITVDGYNNIVCRLEQDIDCGNLPLI